MTPSAFDLPVRPDRRIHRLGRPMRLKRSATLLASTLALGLLTAAPSAQALQIQDNGYSATEAPGNGDGIIGPGDTVNLSESLVSAENTTLTTVRGALASSDPNFAVTQGSSAYPNLSFGTPNAVTNQTPFTIAISPNAECGASDPLTLHVSTDQGNQDVRFAMATGVGAPFRSFTSAQVSLSIPQTGSVISTLNVTQAGRIKALRVAIGHITHNYDGDLEIDLIAPDGTNVVLINPNLSNNGQNFANTVFDQSATTPITSGSAPYTGTYRPEGNLNTLIGKQQQGTWELKVTSISPGNSGTLDSWGVDTSTAICSNTPLAAITASPTPAAPGTPVTFDGSASLAPTPGTSIVDYKWDLDGSGNYATDTGSSPTTPPMTFPTRGTYTIGLRVRDGLHNTGQTTIPFSVTLAPTAALSVAPASPVAASPVTLDASGSTADPAGHIANYHWDLDGSGAYATDTGTTPHVTTTYPTSRTVPVHVRVTDDAGATAIAGQTLLITNAPPSAAFTTPSPVLVGQPVTFDGSTSRDVDGSIASYHWDLDGSGSYATDGGSSPTVTNTYTTPGTVTVGLRVTDNEGASRTVTHSVQVTRPPVAGLTATPGSPTIGTPVRLDAGTSSDLDGAIIDYRWDLDGSGSYATDSGATPFLMHTFSAPGIAQVRVLVTDNFGANASASTTVAVQAANAGGGGTGSGPAGSGGTTGAAPTILGDPQAGIASLTGADLTTILPGSDHYFAAITGAAVRRAKVVSAHGLWLNLVADRPAVFSLTLQLSRPDALQLRLVRSVRRGQHLSALVTLRSFTARLAVGGQKPYDLVMSRSLARMFAGLRSSLRVLVIGTARDQAGHRTALTRAFLIKR